MKKKIFNNKGFSLVELVVTVAIVAIFSSILVPTFVHMTQESKAEQDQIKFESICSALKSAMSQPEVQNELAAEPWNNEEFLIVFTSNADTGEMKLAKAQVAKDVSSQTTLEDMELGKAAIQLMDREYTVAHKHSFGYQLTIKCTPKTHNTVARAEIVSWEAPAP